MWLQLDVSRSDVRGYTPGVHTRRFSLFVYWNPRVTSIYRIIDFNGANVQAGFIVYACFDMQKKIILKIE